MTFFNPWPSFIETVLPAEAVFNIALTLLAQAYTELDINYMNVTGSILSSYRFLAERSIFSTTRFSRPMNELRLRLAFFEGQAGLVLGVVMTFAFAANTMISCQSLDTLINFVAPFLMSPSGVLELQIWSFFLEFFGGL